MIGTFLRAQARGSPIITLSKKKLVLHVNTSCKKLFATAVAHTARRVLFMCGCANLGAVVPGGCRIVLEALVAVPAKEAPAGPAGIHFASTLAFQVSVARGAH